jgi:broad specificity phosphatase PhoE
VARDASAAEPAAQATGVTAAQKWPQRLWIVRHGQSAGNVARDVAEAASLPVIDIAERDMDVPLSSLGHEQSQALGQWFAAQVHDEQPDVVLCSPYRRARQTANAVLQAMGHDPSLARVDERLREKEFGILDRLTRHGIRAKFPELAAQRAHVGKFYFRPPGGESWCDVILRLRSVLDTMTREHNGQRVLIVAHQVIVVCLRYLFERMDETQILDVDHQGDVPNCGVTSYVFDPRAGRRGKLVLERVNFLAPLREAGAPVTTEPDVPAAPKS